MHADPVGACLAGIMRIIVLNGLGFEMAMTDIVDKSTCFVKRTGLQLHAVRQFGIISFCVQGIY